MCAEYIHSQDMSKGSIFVPKEAEWTPQIRTGDIHCLLKHDLHVLESV